MTSTLDKVVMALVIIGGLNWGLIAINADYNIVAKLGETVARIVYGLVGIAAVYSIFVLVKK